MRCPQSEGIRSGVNWIRCEAQSKQTSRDRAGDQRLADTRAGPRSGRGRRREARKGQARARGACRSRPPRARRGSRRPAAPPRLSRQPQSELLQSADHRLDRLPARPAPGAVRGTRTLRIHQLRQVTPEQFLRASGSRSSTTPRLASRKPAIGANNGRSPLSVSNSEISAAASVRAISRMRGTPSDPRTLGVEGGLRAHSR